MSKIMHEVRVLLGDGGNYIVPIELVDDFENTSRLMEDLEPESDEWYDACEGFDSRFEAFNVEGRLGFIPFFVEEGSY